MAPPDDENEDNVSGTEMETVGHSFVVMVLAALVVGVASWLLITSVFGWHSIPATVIALTLGGLAGRLAWNAPWLSPM